MARLLRGPELVSDNCDRGASTHGRNLEHIHDAGDAARRLIVDGLGPSAEHGRMRYERYLHSRQIEIEAESLRTVALVPAVEAADSRADQPKIGWLLELDRRWDGDSRGVGRQF